MRMLPVLPTIYDMELGDELSGAQDGNSQNRLQFLDDAVK
jgi:hypothetical protein